MDREKCPRCGSPDPKLHPAVQFEGEVQECKHPWHLTYKVRPVYDWQVYEYAKSKSIELSGPQMQWISMFLSGHNVSTPRQSGRTTVLNLIRDYFEEHNGA